MDSIIKLKNSGNVLLDDFFYFLLLVSPVVGIYSTPISALSWGEVSLIAVCLYFACKKERNDVKINVNHYCFFIIYSLVITFLMSFTFSEEDAVGTIKEVVSFLVYALLAICLCSFVDRKKFIEMYVFFALAFSCVLIIQFVIHLFVGKWIVPIIPNMISDGSNTNDAIARYSRAASFFKEPAHYVHYMSIPFVYLLFNYRQHKNGFKYLIVFLIAIVFSFSGNGAYVLAVSFIGLVLSKIFDGRVNYFFRGLLISIVVITLAFFVLFYTQYGMDLLFRLNSGELSGGYAARQSGYVRIFRGYVVYAAFDIPHKLFGVGLGNYLQYALTYAYEALTSKTSLNYNYINAVQGYLTQTGIVGLFLYFSIFFKRFGRRSADEKTMICVYVALASTSGLDRCPVWLFFMILLMSPAGLNMFDSGRWIYVYQQSNDEFTTKMIENGI